MATSLTTSLENINIYVTACRLSVIELTHNFIYLSENSSVATKTLKSLQINQSTEKDTAQKVKFSIKDFFSKCDQTS